MKVISDHILDMMQNSIAAGANQVEVSVTELWDEDILKVLISDDGRGMDEVSLERTADPFYTSRKTRRVGMGIPLLRQHAEMTGGNTDVRSAVDSGTTVEATFRINHPDRQPMGDLAGSIVLMMIANPEVEFILKIVTPEGDFSISHAEIKQSLSIDSIAGNELRQQLTNLILNNMTTLGFRT